MNASPAGRASIVAAILVAVGALASSLISFFFLLWGIPNAARTYLLQDPIGWALRPAVQPLAIVAMLLAFVVLVGLTWVFVRLIVRSALPRRGAAVFFGTWGAVIVSALIAGIVRAPLVLSTFGIPAEQSEILTSQFHQIATSGAAWGLNWGWLAALIVALIHRATPAPGAGAPNAGPAHQGHPYSTVESPAQYPPAQYPPAQYPPAPGTAETRQQRHGG